MTGHHDWIIQAIETAGAPVLFGTLTLESFGMPVPGESALIAAAAAAGAGKLSIWSVAMAAWAGAVLGDNIGYLLGRGMGRKVVLAYGARIGVTEARYRSVEAQVAHRGALAVIIARFVVLLRQLNGIVAGTAGMPWLHFLLANMVGAALWVGFWCTLAFKLGTEASLLPLFWQHLKLVAEILVPVLLVVLAGLYLHLRKRRANRPGDPSGRSGDS